jgi:hypothetical protein
MPARVRFNSLEDHVEIAAGAGALLRNVR